MARYTGPKSKVSRRYGVPIFGSSKSLERKNYPPGMHGPRGARRKQSEYAIALGEKQKLRYQYGLLERQFRRIFQNALRKRGVTGETLLQLLETRIDNVVFRLGLANTRNAARQLVSHGHVLVNGRRVNIASVVGPTLRRRPSYVRTSSSSTLSEVRPAICACVPQELLPIMPPKVQETCVEGSGP